MEHFTLISLATWVLYEIIKLLLPFPLPVWGRPLTIAGVAGALSFIPVPKILIVLAATGVVSILEYLFGNNKPPAEAPGKRPDRKIVGIPTL